MKRSKPLRRVSKKREAQGKRWSTLKPKGTRGRKLDAMDTTVKAAVRNRDMGKCRGCGRIEQDGERFDHQHIAKKNTDLGGRLIVRSDPRYSCLLCRPCHGCHESGALKQWVEFRDGKAIQCSHWPGSGRYSEVEV